MYLKNKNVLVLGIGITGISTIKAIYKLGAKIVISDTKNASDLKKFLVEIESIPMEKHLGTDDMDLSRIDLVIKSPGIPPYAKIVIKAIEKNIEIITDIELAYRISKSNKFIAITGTNGKTTCTTLTGEILNQAGISAHIVGNIGTGIMEKLVEADADDAFVIECSSFQLEHTTSFKPNIGLITNITPDHIDWHKTFENYIESKFKVFKNQDVNDYLVLNYDDKILKTLEGKIKSNLIWFSVRGKLSKGIYIEDGYVIINDGLSVEKLMLYSDLKILGKHNLENVLGCIGIALALNIDLDTIRLVLSNFKGVEHRIEFVDVKKGITFYNDSKGTNPDATIKAIEAVNAPIILIAGGYDKGSCFDELIKAFDGKVKALILLGETKDIIKSAALSNGFNSIYEVDSIKEAVKLSYEIGKSNDNVLLSPACASWDMYLSYEARGRDFKGVVRSLLE